ncbi:unnamed protein product [Musa hybrid cultivar]
MLHHIGFGATKIIRFHCDYQRYYIEYAPFSLFFERDREATTNSFQNRIQNPRWREHETMNSEAKMRSYFTEVGGGRLRVGDEAAGTVGAGVLALDTAGEGEEAEPPRALHVGGHHRAAAVRAAPRRLLRPQHLLLLAAQQHQTHLPPSRLRLRLLPPPATKDPLDLSRL